jgi:hypothetical protein
VLKEGKVLRVQRVHRGLQVQRVLKEDKEHRVLKVHRGLKVPRELKEVKVLKGQQVLKEL